MNFKTLILTLAFASQLYAADDIDIQPRVSSYHSKQFVRDLGITHAQLIYASKKYEDILKNDYIDGLPKIYERQQYIELVQLDYTSQMSEGEKQRAFQKLHNDIKSDLASYLGLSINDYDKFMSSVAPHIQKKLEKGYSNSDEPIYSPKSSPDEIERIETYCQDGCTRGPGGIELAMHVYFVASQQGITPRTVYNPSASFMVKFRDRNTGYVMKTEEWAYNDFSGAWSIAPQPCSICHPDY